MCLSVYLKFWIEYGRIKYALIMKTNIKVEIQNDIVQIVFVMNFVWKATVLGAAIGNFKKKFKNAITLSLFLILFFLPLSHYVVHNYLEVGLPYKN